MPEPCHVMQGCLTGFASLPHASSILSRASSSLSGADNTYASHALIPCERRKGWMTARIDTSYIQQERPRIPADFNLHGSQGPASSLSSADDTYASVPSSFVKDASTKHASAG